jgi:hypothetical protein
LSGLVARALALVVVRSRRQRQGGEAIFCPRVAIAETPLVNRAVGLVCASVRIRSTEKDFRPHLQKAFLKLFQIFGSGSGKEWEVTATANAVVVGHSKPTFSFFYGMDFGRRDFTLAPSEAETNYTVVRSLGDVAKIPTDYSEEHFADAFFNYFANSDVSIHSLPNICFLARRLIQNFDRDKTVGRRLVTLY